MIPKIDDITGIPTFITSDFVNPFYTHLREQSFRILVPL